MIRAVRGGIVAVVVVLAAIAATVSAWSCTSNPDCTCTIDQNGDHRVIACGDNACVGGTQFTCTNGTATPRSGCEPTPPAPTPNEGGPPPDTSCQDLQSFCDTQCHKPVAVASDCANTAAAGNGPQCASWQSSNAVLCSP
jgi:hypothetical protein